MAFGTAVTCYVPVEKRKGGKEPAQRKSFRGVILGYVDGMPAYRVWDISECSVKQISYNFCICHEGYYPFREKKNLPSFSLNAPKKFSPITDGVLSVSEWKKFSFDTEEAEEVLSVAPDLLVDYPDGAPRDDDDKHAEDHVPVADAEVKSGTRDVDVPHGVCEPLAMPLDPLDPVVAPKAPRSDSKPRPNIQEFTKKFRSLWSDDLPLSPRQKYSDPVCVSSDHSEVTPDLGQVTPARVCVSPRPQRDRQPSRKLLDSMESHLSLVDPIPDPVPDKPISILPPKTLWEAQMCPWWLQYKLAMQAEYDGHLKRGTWTEVPLKTIGDKNILRSKWVFDDKRSEKGHMVKFKARLVAMGCIPKGRGRLWRNLRWSGGGKVLPYHAGYPGYGPLL